MSSLNENANPPARHSLRTELLTVQLVVLLLVVVGFGGAIYALVRQSIYREVEADLLGAAQTIRQELADRKPLTTSAITSTYWHRFGPAPRDRAYFAVWSAQGVQIAGSDNLPVGAVPLDRLPPDDGPRPFTARSGSGVLEVFVRTASGGQILIGRPLGKESDRLRSLLWRVFLLGGLALFAGGCASWWLARRIARPLERLTKTAERISARQLDDRLQPPPGPAELTQLAIVFNGMLDRLQGAFERQVRFTADASHELRTPVAVILAQTEHTLSRPRSVEEYQTALTTCTRAAKGMKGLVDDLLLLARADAQQLVARREAQDLAVIARDTLAWLAPLADNKQLRFAFQLHAAAANCDAAQLRQVIVNLVTNAIEHSPIAGEINVSTEVLHDRALLRVQDFGGGIAAADKCRIFERFYRADTARTRSGGHGAGLGLSIVAEIVARNGGSIEVTSEPGNGAQFTVSLPRATPLVTDYQTPP